MLDEPSANISEDVLIVIEDEEAIIECDIDANPSDNLTVTWWHDNKLIDNERFSHYVDDSVGVLEIQGVQADDAGQYHCQVENVVGEAFSNPTTLDVLCKYQQTIYIVSQKKGSND